MSLASSNANALIAFPDCYPLTFIPTFAKYIETPDYKYTIEINPLRDSIKNCAVLI
jgi:hypothetical protein